jgi:solute carrier family 38 (sodium-coupled neutral amino acid transporter), member 9
MSRLRNPIETDSSGSEEEALLLSPKKPSMNSKLIEDTPILPIDGILPDKKPSGASVVFSIWNTMIGSTLLSIPWAWDNAGLFLGFIIFIVIASISTYTVILIVRHGRGHTDFSEVCVKHLGGWTRPFSLAVSLSVLLGAIIAYHIYMAYALRDAVSGGFEFAGGSAPSFWNATVAAILIIFVLYPIACAPSMGGLIRFNSFGIFFVYFLLLFMIYESIYHVAEAPSIHSAVRITMAGSSVGNLFGVLNLSFFIHSAILSMVARVGSEADKKRYVVFGYFYCALCYLIPGIIVGLAFSRADLPQNFLVYFSVTDVMAFIARLSLLLQLTTVYPLLQYIMRIQLLSLLGKGQMQFFVRLGFHLIPCIITTLVTIFYPHVGVILGMTGAFCGFVYIYFLPISVHLIDGRKKGALTGPSIIFHGMLMTVGLACIVLQFVSP